MWNPFKGSLVRKPARDITGDVWMNVTSLSDDAKQAALSHAPLRFEKELSGVVTLVHFWDYSSPDSVDDLPYMHSWWEMYESPQFVIIGVHTPQYEFAKDADKVEAALIRFYLDYPIVNDAEYTTWKRYGNNVWPRKILVDAKGIIRFDHRGKGGHEELELKIQELLERVKESGQVIPPGNTVTPPISLDRTSMSARGIAVSPLTDPAQYHVPNKVALHEIALSGWWVTGEMEIVTGPLSDDQSCVAHFFGSACTARMRPSNQEGATVQVFVDNKKVGEDIHVVADEEYVLVSDLPFAAHHLTVIPVQESLAISSFSFS